LALARQVLDRLILEKIQISMAEKSGLRVDDETLRQTIQQIAQKNNMSPEDLRGSLRAEGIEYPDFLEQIRGELAQQRLRSSQVNSQIKISDREVQNWMEARLKAGANPNVEYQIGQILIATPQGATPETVQAAREKAEKLIADLRKGADFRQVSLSSSDASEALKGGDLGWRKLSELPTIYADAVPKMKKGAIEGPIRSPSGFHIIKLMDQRGSDVESITKTRVRHILLKPNEVMTNDDARKKLETIKTRIQAGDDFGELARGNSDDKGSAVKGGDLGFVAPGALVPEFEQAMNDLKPNELSEPVQSQFGWHLIQVLERQESDDTNELLKKQAQDEIFKRKVDEETELWLRRIRDEAYVEIRVPELMPEGASAEPSKPSP
jgi:peptidyl-prolyl cis-trans isomerase SurA